MAIIDRIKNILLSPRTEWPVIATEAPSVQSLYVDYILILSAIGPIALALSSGMFGAGLGLALASYAIGLVIVYVVAWIVDVLAPTFGGEKHFVRSLQLVAYSYTAAWVAGILNLIPFFGSLLALAASIYSLYTFYLGVPLLKKCPPQKALAYTIVVAICGIVVVIAVFSVLSAMLMGGGMVGMMGMGR
ncbi:MAG: YIP1 family protein [Burkholderiales bacterium]|nr:YIP1 family protein [Burkholderiales bacterium]